MNTITKILLSIFPLIAALHQMRILKQGEMNLSWLPFNGITNGAILFGILLVTIIFLIVRIWRFQKLKYEYKWNWLFALVMLNVFAILVYLWLYDKKILQKESNVEL